MMRRLAIGALAAALAAALLAWSAARAPEASERCPPLPNIDDATARPALAHARATRAARCLYRALVEAERLGAARYLLGQTIAEHDRAQTRLSAATQALHARLVGRQGLSEQGFVRYLYGSYGLAARDRSSANPAPRHAPFTRHEREQILHGAHEWLQAAAPPGVQRPWLRGEPAQPSTAFEHAIARARSRERNTRTLQPLRGLKAERALAHALDRIAPRQGRHDHPDPRRAAAEAVAATTQAIAAEPARYLHQKQLSRRLRCTLLDGVADPERPCPPQAGRHPHGPRAWLAAFKTERTLACHTEGLNAHVQRDAWMTPRCTGEREMLLEHALAGRANAWKTHANGARHQHTRLTERVRNAPATAALSAALTRLNVLGEADPHPERGTAARCLAKTLADCAARRWGLATAPLDTGPDTAPDACPAEPPPCR